MVIDTIVLHSTHRVTLVTRQISLSRIRLSGLLSQAAEDVSPRRVPRRRRTGGIDRSMHQGQFQSLNAGDAPFTATCASRWPSCRRSSCGMTGGGQPGRRLAQRRRLRQCWHRPHPATSARATRKPRPSARCRSGRLRRDDGPLIRVLVWRGRYLLPRGNPARDTRHTGKASGFMFFRNRSVPRRPPHRRVCYENPWPLCRLSPRRMTFSAR